ncbi:MFS transporter [Gemmatimonadetes bacterium T265]|nr:MFS transporter [Gemmatimonadetes bacterium T265]
MTARTSVVFSALVAALGGLLFGFDTAVISGTDQALQRVFALDASGLGTVVTWAILGTIVGAFTAGPPAERLGRRRVLFVLALGFFVAAVGTALASSLAMFVAFRFLGGLAVGGASVVSPLYIAEIAPARLRGRLVALNQLNIVAGILIAFLSNFVIARAIPGDTAWRWMLGVQAFPAAAFFLLLFAIPESPRWLAKQGRTDEARRVLARVADGGEAGADAELGAITASLAEDNATGVHLHERLFQRRYARPILLAVVIAVLNQLSGINAVLYYAPRVFRQAGSGTDSALLQSVLVGGTNLVFTVLALFIIDRFGRRPLLAAGGIGAAASLGLTALGFAHPAAPSVGLVLAGLVGFIASHAIGQGAVIWVFISEIFPNAVREKGGALGSFTHWVMAALVTRFFPVVAQSSGTMVFAFFALMMFLQFFFAWRVMPETKGFSLEALQTRLGMDAAESGAVPAAPASARVG